MTLRRPIGFGTKAIHGRKHQDKHEPGGKNPYRTLSTPIFMSSTFAFENADHGAAIFSGQSPDYTYTRIGNPTTAALESEIAYLEGGEKGLAFASGMAAISHFTFALARPGDQFVFTKTIYGGTYKFFAHTCREVFQMNAVAVDGTNLDEVAAAVDDQTKFLFIETPANPTIAMVDIAGCAAIAKKHGVPLAVDNTFATPYLQNPIEFGADYIVHSATKYLSGHGDTVGGLLVGPAAMMTQIHKQIATMVGGCISPFNSWLLLRGIRSLPVRMDRHCANAMEIAQFLSFHPKVARVYYPACAPTRIMNWPSGRCATSAAWWRST
jgi:methionine-gamma-lyase